MTALALKAVNNSDHFSEDFAANAGHLPGAGLAWLDARRKKAIAAFALKGMPTRRLEAWKYTDLASALEQGSEPVKPAHAVQPHAPVFAGVESFPLSLIDGVLHFDATRVPGGLEVVDLARLDANTPAWVKEHLGMLRRLRTSLWARPRSP